MKIKVSKELRYVTKRLTGRLLKYLFLLGPCFVLSTLAAFLHASELGQRFDLAELSAFFRVRGPLSIPNDIVIVSIDDETYRRLEASPNYPIPRRHLATALENLADASPRVLIIDGAAPQERTIDPQADDRIASVLERTQASIWSGRIGDNDLSSHVPTDEKIRRSAKFEIDMFFSDFAGYPIFVGDWTLQEKIARDVLVSPSTKGKERDVLYRFAPIVQPLIEVGEFSIVQPPKNALINFIGGSNTIPRVSVVDLIQGDVAAAKSKLKDKVVLLGYQSLRFGKGSRSTDQFPVPVEGRDMFGVEVHANIVANLLHRNWLDRLKPLDEALFVWLLVFVLSVIVLWEASRLAVILVAGANLLLWAVAYICFARFNFFVAGILSIGAASCVAIALGFLYFDSRIQRFDEYLKKTFNFETEREL